MSIVQNVDKLKMLREKSGLSQAKLAKYVNISEARYQNYEKGRRNMPIKLARSMADIFDVNWWELYEE
ncbi:helix-turn-helix transcriptional regulator [Helcococcus sueciensis]|uniref:helix-turn-helix transcriptional regulator n=1 Tax=Helcococcus sueciensis TaxID=241555 RepID=UPI0004084769|nr:helix-turn-helix transcriptional regulator [Helcococcus sueciensis]